MKWHEKKPLKAACWTLLGVYATVMASCVITGSSETVDSNQPSGQESGVDKVADEASAGVPHTRATWEDDNGGSEFILGLGAGIIGVVGALGVVSLLDPRKREGAILRLERCKLSYDEQLAFEIIRQREPDLDSM